ncbi:MAG: hypothetical protein Wins2KO_15260 [Winogradskyella sp.]
MKVLIVGCERSGTTVISKLLSTASNSSFLNDPKDSWYIYPLVNIVGVRGFTLSLISRLWRYDIVKVPGFATILNELRRVHFRRYKVIYVVRDPRDNIAAIKERLKKDLNGLYLNVHFLQKSGSSITENILLRWLSYLRKAREYEKKYPNDIIFVKYEDFLKDKIGTVKLIAEFCNLKFKEELIEEIKDEQINKFWSSQIKGAKRYLTELNTEEIDYINKIAENEIREFNY